MHQSYWTADASGSTGGSVYDANWHKYYCIGGSGYLYIDDVYKGGSHAASSDSDYPITFYLFAVNSNSSPQGATQFSSIQMEYMKIWDKDGNLVRDFIPCLDSNNRPCMYDNVTQTPFYNQGQGEFTYGSPI